MSRGRQREIPVYADWRELGAPVLMGTLFAAASRGSETFSFEYARAWLEGPDRL